MPLGNIRRCRNHNSVGTSRIPMSDAVRSSSLLITCDLADASAKSARCCSGQCLGQVVGLPCGPRAVGQAAQTAVYGLRCGGGGRGPAPCAEKPRPLVACRLRRRRHAGRSPSSSPSTTNNWRTNGSACNANWRPRSRSGRCSRSDPPQCRSNCWCATLARWGSSPSCPPPAGWPLCPPRCCRRCPKPAAKTRCTRATRHRATGPRERGRRARRNCCTFPAPVHPGSKPRRARPRRGPVRHRSRFRSRPRPAPVRRACSHCWRARPAQVRQRGCARQWSTPPVPVRRPGCRKPCAASPRPPGCPMAPAAPGPNCGGGPHPSWSHCCVTDGDA